MKEARKSLLRTGLIWAVALMGLFTAQSALMLRTYQLEKAAFRQNVQNAMGSVVLKLESRETMAAMYSIVLRMDGSDSGQVTIAGSWQDSVDIVITPGPAQANSGRRLRRFNSERLETGQTMAVQPTQDLQIVAYTDSTALPPFPRGDGAVWHGLGRYTTATRALPFSAKQADSLAQHLSRSPRLFWSTAQDTGAVERREIMVEKLLRRLQEGETQSALTRLAAVNLDSLITGTLNENGIHRPVQYGLFHLPADTLILKSNPADVAALEATPFRTRLFPADTGPHSEILALAFPAAPFQHLGHLGAFGLTVLLFLIVIIAASASLFRRALAQQRFSRTLIDFINNMTHEFKTPISTLSLISEHLRFSGKTMETGRLNRYGQIIHDESLRMRGQVEKILQMASLEQGDIELKREAVDLHALIAQAVENLTPQVQRAQGRFRTRLQATQPVLLADRQHLGNMLYNLMDNAIKYTPDTPDILIETANSGGMCLISVKDNGMGLRAEDAARVFEKYFRVSTGNVHNVKGFGLGLAYVALLARAHGGDISVESQRGEGSTFTLTLPLEEKQ